MPKRTISEKTEGIREEAPDVVIIYKDEQPLVWESQNYYGDGDSVEFTLLPGEKEEFNREYAKMVFGNWELKKDTKAEQKVWGDMIKDRIDRSPTSDGRLPMVEIFEADGTKIWDAKEQFMEWMEKHGAKMLPKPDAKSGIEFKMPAILAEADAATLRKLFEHAYGCKMPSGMKHGDVRKALLVKLGPEQITDVLAGEFEFDPDMSKYVRHER